MRDVDTALDLLRSVNPIATVDAVDPDELETSAAACATAVEGDVRTQPGGVAVVPLPDVRAPWRSPGVLRPVVVAVAAFAVVVMAVVTVGFVGRSSEPPAAPNPLPVLPATTVIDSASTTFAPGPGEPAPPYELAVERGIEYWSDGDATFTVDVYYPAEGDGPWPVVVTFPENTVGSKDASTARAMAERGAVAFAPVTVVAPGQLSAEYIDGFLFDRGACAVGFAQAHADTYGGDPERTTVMGDAGGEHPAVWSALGLVRDDVCKDPIRYPPVGLVAGSPQWLFETDYWDEALADPQQNARDTLDRFWNPDRWDPAGELRVHLWVTASPFYQRPIELPITDTSWIQQRDTTGTLVDDLETVGAFVDGSIGFNDNARLMYLRMRAAGLSVTFDEMATMEWAVESTQFDRMWSIVSAD